MNFTFAFLKKIIHLTLGILFLLIGLAGLVLPILNGLLFLILGAIIISLESSYVEKKLLLIVKKNAHVYAFYSKLDAFARKVLKK